MLGLWENLDVDVVVVVDQGEPSAGRGDRRIVFVQVRRTEMIKARSEESLKSVL